MKYKYQDEGKQYRDREVILQWKSGVLLKRIMNAFNISYATIYNILKKHGVKTGHAGEKVHQLDLFLD